MQSNEPARMTHDPFKLLIYFIELVFSILCLSRSEGFMIWNSESGEMEERFWYLFAVLTF